MANTQEINIPVRLKVLQESVSDFQKVLDNLQPNTDKWKQLKRLIDSMTSESQKLQAQMSTPFSSEKQFSSTSKTIDKLEETAARVAIVMQSLKFSDIKLTPAQTQEMEKFEKEIEDIRQAYAKLEEDTKKKVISNTDNADLLNGINANLVNKNFSEIETAVDQHINKLKQKVADQQNAFDKLKSNIELGMKATALTTSGKGLTREALGDTIFDKFLSETSNGLKVKSWNPGITKQALLATLEETFNLTPGDLQHLASKTIDDINAAFQKMGTKEGGVNPFSKIISRGKENKSREPLKNQELNELKAQLDEYNRLREEMAKLKTTELMPADSANAAKVTDLQTRMDSLRQTILANIGATSGYAGSMQKLTSQFPQLRSVLESTNTQFLRMQQIQNSFNSMKMTIANFMGFTQVLNLTKRALKEAANHIKELDSVMNKISIVTNLDTSDLWGQIDQYSEMAQRYGTSIKGAYEVSQIYYQQGLDSTDVLTLTNETLKLAKISGLDYAATTDYMTTALRGFKMEMTEASTVVDVYSNLAAHTAVTQEELAVAMSKTASSLESVGTTFEEASAMISTMVAVTRESATNIGSAMKSIAARYGEMKSNPTALADAEGEALSYNKVDTALQSVGISMKTAEGQFREFTDVIIELGEKWDQLESTQQRYIATQFAGNRQQSRFLALISNVDLLKSNLNYAENSEDVGTIQAIKALDSLESKIEQVRVAYQQFYTTVGVESAWKGLLDVLKNIINTLNGMPKLFGKLPVGAINAIAQVISVLKNLALQGLANIAKMIGPTLLQSVKGSETEAEQAGGAWVDGIIRGIKSRFNLLTNTGKTITQALNTGFLNTGNISAKDKEQAAIWTARIQNSDNAANPVGERYAVAQEMQSAGKLSSLGMQMMLNSANSAREVMNNYNQVITISAQKTVALSGTLTGLGSMLNMISLLVNTTTRSGKALSGGLQIIAGAAMLAGTAISTAGAIASKAFDSIPWLAIARAVISIINGIIQVIQSNSIEAKLEEFTKKAEELSDKAKELKANYNTLKSSVEKYHELEQARYDSAEAAKEYQEAVDKIAEAYPQLIESYSIEGDAILNASALEQTLATARDEAAEATLRAAEAEAAKARVEKEKDKSDLYKSNDAFDDYIDVKTGWGNRFKNYDEISKKSGIKAVDDANEQLTKYMRDMNSAIEKEEPDINAIFEANEKIEEILGQYGLVLSEGLDTERKKIIEAASKYRSDDKIIEAADKSTVSAYLNKQYGSSSSNSIFKQNGALLNIAAQAIYNDIETSTKNFSTGNIRERSNTILSTVQQDWGNLTDTQSQEMNKILENSDNYTSQDLIDKAEEYGVTVRNWMIKVFDQSSEENAKAIESKINQLSDSGINNDELNKVSNKIKNQSVTLKERQLLVAGLNQVQSLQKNGYEYSNFITDFLDVYSSIAQLPADVRNNLIDEFTKNGFTKEGLQKTLSYISDNEITGVKTDKIESIIGSTIPNIQLALDTAMSNLTENLDKIESVSSSLQSGVKSSKLEKTIAEAKQLGLNIKREDFYQDGDKFVIQPERLEAELQSLDDQYREQFKGIQDNLAQSLNRVYNDATKVEDARLVLGGKFEQYYEKQETVDENGNKIVSWVRNKKSNEEFQQALVDSYFETNEELKNYFTFLDQVNAQLQKTSQWKQGNYKSLTTLGLKSKNYQTEEAALARIRALAAGANMEDEEYQQPDVLNAVESYQKGFGTFINDISNKNIEYLRNKAAYYEGVPASVVNDILDQIDSGSLTLVGAIRQYAEEAGKTIQETNQLIVNAINKQNKTGAAQGVSELISGQGFTADEFNQFITKYMPDDTKISKFIGDDGKLVDQALASVYELDEATGKYKQIKNATLDQILNAWTTALGTDIRNYPELYQDVLSKWTSEQITELDKNDIGKQATNILSSISSGKVGTRIDTSKSPELEKLLGTEATHYYEIASEFARDSMIMALDATSIDDDEWRITVQGLQETIKQKRSKGKALQGIMTKSFNRDAAKTYMSSIGYNPDDINLDESMAARGYVWDEYLQEYRATQAALDYVNNKIEEASAENASEETINKLQEEAEKLAYQLQEDPKEAALKNLLSSYSDISDDVLATFKAQFDINIEDYVTEEKGVKKVDIERLRAAIGTEWSKYFDDVINSIADEYINNASKATQLISQGTTSKVDMQVFAKAYKDLTGFDISFVYDPILKAWTTDISNIETYLTAAAAKLNLTPDQQKQWVQQQIDAITVENLDFSSYLSGTATAKETQKLKYDLGNYVKTHLPTEYDLWPEEDQQEYLTKQVDNILNNLSKGGKEAMDQIKNIKGDATTESDLKSAYESEINPIKAAAESLNQIAVGTFVETSQIQALTAAGFEFDGNIVTKVATDLVAAYKSLYQQMADTGESTVHSLNSIAKLGLEQKYSSTKVASENLSKGVISLSELVDMYDAAGKVFGETVIDDEGKETKDYQAELDRLVSQGFIQVDQLGNVVITDFVGMAAELALKEGTREYKEAYSAYIDAQIAENEKHDTKAREASQISKLRSGKIGETVNITDISPELKQMMGITGDTYKILSEYERDTMLLAIDAANIENERIKQEVVDAQREIKEGRAAGRSISGIISRTMDMSALRSYLSSQLDVEKYSDRTLQKLMENRGYVWDEYTQQFIATTKALDYINDQIQLAIDKHASDETIAQLRQQAAELEAELEKDPVRDALVNLLNNYTNADSAISEFKARFGDKINIDQFVDTDIRGQKSIRIAELRAALQAAGYNYDEVFTKYIAQLSDEYINNASKAATLVTKGTNSQTEIQTFQETYSKLMSGKTVQFYYDDVLEAYTFDPSLLREYVEKQANELVKLGQLSQSSRNQWIKDQIDSVTVDNLNFSSYLNGTATENDIAKLKRELEVYVQTHFPENFEKMPEEAKKQYTESMSTILEQLAEGGQHAVDVIKSLKGDKITKDEIEAAYRAEVAPIKAVYDSLANLQAGSVVASNQIKILEEAGFTVDANGVVQAVGNLIIAYRSIYQQMKATGEATVAELNTALGAYLDNRDGEQQAIDALSNAANMTYSQLAEIYTKANKELTEDIVNNLMNSGVIKSLGGNKIMIQDFAAFADKMDWDLGTEEYWEALNTYTDSIVKYNTTMKDGLKSEFDAISSIKPKTDAQINVTRFIEQYGSEAVSNLLNQFGATLEGNIAKITKTTNLTDLIGALGEVGINGGWLNTNETVAALDQLRTKVQADLSSSLSSMVQNYASISVETIRTYADASNLTYTEALNVLQLAENGDGTYKAELNNLRVLIDSKRAELGETVYNNLIAQIYQVIDSVLGQITNAVSYSISGTSNMSDMAEFTHKYNELTGQTASLDTLFNYNEYLESYTLTSDALKQYQDAQRQYLINLGMGESAVDAYLKQQTNELIRNLDFSGFLNGGYLNAQSKETQELVNQLRYVYQNIDTEMSEESWINGNLNALLQGGEAAYLVLKNIKGEQNISADEAASVYKFAAERLKASVGAMNSQVGDIVDSYTATLFKTAGAITVDLGNGQFAIQSIPYENWGEKIADAYKALYATLAKSSEVSVSDLNSALAKIIETSESKQSNPVEALSNAASMTYTALGEILAKEGKKLEDVIGNPDQYGIQALGGGKVRIADFTKFAEEMKWDTSTEEYLNAFNSYNDAMIQLNLDTQNKIMDEVKNITSAKIGDKLNFTYLWHELSEQAQKQASTTLELYGATIKDGILEINANADIQGIIGAITNLAADNADLLPDQLAELQDAVQDYIKKIADAIKTGITGGLTNAGAQQLQTWALERGIKDLDFRKTANGLQLSQESAIKLYNALKQVDSLQASLVFDELNESLKKTNDSFKSTSSLINHVEDLQSKIDELVANRGSLNEVDQKMTDAKINQYKEELALAKEILAVRATQEDESYNFMSNKIPAAQNNPLNYLKNWSEAFKKMSEAGKASGKMKNKMDYTDFYNIITEMGNLADKSGDIKLSGKQVLSNSQDAANLIEKAATALTIASDGTVKVDLSKLGIDFSTGAKDLKNNVGKGIKSLASSQVQMLDGMIKLLETIVAMENLGDIDVDQNGIDLEDIVETYMIGDKEYKRLTPKYKEWLKTLDELAAKDEEVKKSMDAVKVGNKSLWEIAHQAADQFTETDAMIMRAFYEAAKSGNYDLDNITQSIISVLQESGLTDTITIDVGDTTLMITGQTITQIDWTSADNAKILDSISKNRQEAIDKAKTWLAKYGTSEGLQEEEIKYVLALKGNVELDGKGQVTKVVVDGQDYAGNPVQAKRAMYAQALLDAGFKFNAKEQITGDETIPVQTEVKLGQHTLIVKSDEKGIKWYDENGKLYNSKQQYLDEWWKQFAKDNGISEKNIDEKEKQVYKEFNIRAQVAANMTVDDSTSFDFTSNPQARADLEKKIEEIRNGLQLSFNEYGNLDLKLDNGMKLTIDGDIVVDDVDSTKVNADKLIAFLTKNGLGIDTALADTIKTGIASALPSMVEALNGLEATPLQNVATALGDILTNAQQLAQVDWETISKGLASINNGNQSETNTSQVPEEQTQTRQSTATRVGTLGGSYGQEAPVGKVDVTAEGEGITLLKQLMSSSIDIPPMELTLDEAIKQFLDSDEKEIKLTVTGEDVDLFRELNDTENVITTKIDSNLDEIIKQYGEAARQAGSDIQESSTIFLDAAKQVSTTTSSAADNTFTFADSVKAAGDATAAAADAVGQAANAVSNAINDLPDSKTIDVKVNISVEASGGTVDSTEPDGEVSIKEPAATGNVALAAGTLMGELGPELVVSGGRYFVAGQNGAEFVDLEDDAIVFNHLQTQQLLKNGMSPSRGKALTSERNAVAFAKGSLQGGPAAASARAALAALKQLRAQWQALQNLSAQDLANLGGSGGGGGGGGKDKSDPARKAWIEAVERWYDLMQEIAKLEKEITHEEALRTKLSSDWKKNGAAYYESQKRSLRDIEQQTIAQEQLNIDKRDYFNQRRQQLNEYGAFKDWYQFDEQGQLKYNEGALAFLSDLTARDANNVPQYSLEEQYNILLSKGYGAQMQYTSSGEQIQPPEVKEGETPDYSDFYSKSIQAVWDQVQAEKDEMQNLYDTIADGETKVLELEEQRNKILEEIRENQLKVEDRLLNAIESQRQQAIDKLSDERNALEESTSKYIQGLSDALNREKQMYQNNQDEEELNRMRRQLAILQRSNAPASQINSLQDEIRSKEQDTYFNLQQQQIDKIQEASDLEIERLDTQIELMTTTLEYEKEHGLLWGAVQDWMFNRSAYEIANYILRNDEQMWGASPLETEKQYQEDLFIAQQWEAFQKDQAAYNDYMQRENGYQQTVSDAVYGASSTYNWNVFNTAMTKLYGDQWKKIASSMQNSFLNNYSKTGDITKAASDLTNSITSLGSSMTSALNSAYSAGVSAAYTPSTGGSGGGGSSGGGSGGSSGGGGKHKVGGLSGWKSNNSQHWKEQSWSDGSVTKEQVGSHNWNKKISTGGTRTCYCSVCDHYMGIVYPGDAHYASGGMINFTGPAWVDGTKSRPEAVLNAEQTKILRDDILSNKPTSLMNLLLDFKNAYSGMDSGYQSINNDTGIVIENATVQMNVEQISNDYDARRAGEQALAEMMRIARKTSAKNSVGR